MLGLSIKPAIDAWTPLALVLCMRSGPSCGGKCKTDWEMRKSSLTTVDQRGTMILTQAHATMSTISVDHGAVGITIAVTCNSFLLPRKRWH